MESQSNSSLHPDHWQQALHQVVMLQVASQSSKSTLATQKLAVLSLADLAKNHSNLCQPMMTKFSSSI